MDRILKARIAGRINHEAIQYGFACAKPGISLLELDKYIENFILVEGGKPAFKGYKGFSGASCLSVNNVAVHGVPNEYLLVDTDILTIDLGTIYEGIYADSARTEIIGGPLSFPHISSWLIDETEIILNHQMAILRPGVSLLDIAIAGEMAAYEANNNSIRKLNLVESLGGHYIGEKLHLDPFIPNTLDYRKGSLNVDIQRRRYSSHFLKEGDILCIEPVTTIGPTDLTVDADGWTCRTGAISAHFEHTIFITSNGYEILT
jgi:methionyl aminopeptidase